MLSPRLTDCPNCPNLPDLISDIDCKLSELSTNLYNNVVFSLNNNIPAVAIIDLLNYKRILTFKLCNPDYASGCGYNVQTIASKVRLLTSDANNCCRNNKILSNTPTNTTTTSSSSSTSTSSTSSTSTTSSTSSTTTSSTTININSQLSFYYGIPICLFGGPFLSIYDCTSACSGYNPYECTTFYLSPLCSVNLSVGCILYTDNTYTTQVDSSYDGFYSDGTYCYEIVNGIVINKSGCPSPTTTTTTTAYITNCSGINSVRPPVNVNGNAITATYTGINIYPQGLGPGWFICSGANPTGDNVWLGMPNTSNDPFTYTIHFSVPVNNIRLKIAVMGVPCDETYTFTTDAGDPTITAVYSCYATITGNQIIGGLGSSFGIISGGGGEFTMTASSSYTSLTISGTSECAGSLFGIVCSSI
jgi:hypothetical protein